MGHDMITRPEELESLRRAAEKVVQTHQRLAPWLRAGLTLAEVDRKVAEILDALACRSAFLGYRLPRYPAFPSYACLSLNDVVVHGTAGMTMEPLKPGDVFSIDIGVLHHGWVGDAAWTYIIESADAQSTKLCQCARTALQRGVLQLQPGRKLIEWARAVQDHVEGECGFHCVEGLGGHGYGFKTLHGPPFVANVVPTFAGEWPDADLVLQPGMTIAVEPMVAVGTPKVTQAPKHWPIRSADGSIAVHFEHDVYISAEGPDVLTRGLEELPLVVG